ncbi:IS481 family transposase [Pseudoglutamicibacter albus]|uniref:Transposase InsO family protein n=1 Tax=Pseudoglutamicibacter albus TaxID=98671 RepID=A0ABU1Z2X5_9MICC|nr:IS481 family transposase [Pseudoglutamicibacter albus]MDR7294111.1 transposase InsO family protein [Pseudoglutamicibacter albus]MDR7294505.1 transposase InsO family protein [Pseudoglutamicibacter albus]
MSHPNAPLTAEGRRRLAVLIVEEGWTIRRAAERFQVSPATASKWAKRYLVGAPLTDRSCRPRRCPNRLSVRRERRIIALRFTRQWGPHRISYHLGIPRSTVGRVLARYQMPLLAHIDRGTGLPIRTPHIARYEKQAPGELVHVDIKKLGRIPDGGGHRMLGPEARKNGGYGKHGRGYAFLHHAIDDYSRLAYSEILTDEKKQTAAGFWQRAQEFFAQAGITVQAVMTDNGACYRSRLFNNTLGTKIKHQFTKPYRPQTNGKVERFNRTLTQEWAYAKTYYSDEARAATYEAWLHHYNHHRPHTGIGGQTPAQRVHNLTGNYN